MSLTFLKRSLQTFTTLGYKILSPCCIICHENAKRNLDLCHNCEQQFNVIKTACYQCGLPLANTHHHAICGQCLQRPPKFQHCISLASYQSPIDQLINQLKYQQQLVNAHVLGRLLATKLTTHYAKRTLPELIIPVPLHRKRLRQRGYNQAVEIAKPISRQLKIKLDKFNCTRNINTPAQSQLTAKQRRRNLHDAFLCKRLRAKHIAIVDDVITTTSTVNELSRTLRQAGAERIDVWCVARTVLR